MQISEDGQTVSITVTNEKIPEIPQTGDDRMLTVFLAALVLSVISILMLRKRRLQKLVFPNGFYYDKNNEHIEPVSINSFFELKYSYPTICNSIKKGTNRPNNDLSLRVLEAGLEPAQLQ